MCLKVTQLWADTCAREWVSILMLVLGGVTSPSLKGENPQLVLLSLDTCVTQQKPYKYYLVQKLFQMGNRYVLYLSNYSISVHTEKNGLSFIETSALDSTNVEAAFQTILTGESCRALCFKGEGQKAAQI